MAMLVLTDDLGLTQQQIEELRRVFRLFDTNNSGYINRTELTQAAQKVKFAGVSSDHVLNVLDDSRDGRVSFQEFAEATVYTTNRRGQSTVYASALIRLVAKSYVRKNDDESDSYLASYKFWPPPLFMICFSIVEIALFAYFAQRECGPNDHDNVGLECPLSFSSELAFRPGCREEVWRFITYMLVHAGISHILFNVLLQIVVGVPLEMVHGPLRTCGVYLVGGLAGSLASSVFDPETNLVGASAGVYALVGAHVADVFLNWSEMPFRWPRAIVLGVLFVMDFSISLYQRYGTESGSNISYTGHLAGFIMGCTLGTRILKNLRNTDYEAIVAWVGIGIATVGVIFALFWNIFYDYKTDGCPAP